MDSPPRLGQLGGDSLKTGLHADRENAMPGHTGIPFLVLDETNRNILTLLTSQGRATIRGIADRVGRTESTVRERVASLERHGIVTGYRARVDWGLAGFPLLALFEGHCDPANVDAVAQRLGQMPNVDCALSTTGLRNLTLLVRTRDAAHAVQVLRQLAQAPIADLHVRFTLRELVPERQPRPPGMTQTPAGQGIGAVMKPPPAVKVHVWSMASAADAQPTEPWTLVHA